MKILIQIIILGDGAGAFLGALVASRLKTTIGRTPWFARLLCAFLGLYAVARFGAVWNLIANGRELASCAVLISPTFARWSLTFNAIQSLGVWTVTIMLIVAVMNGQITSRIETFKNFLKRT